MICARLQSTARYKHKRYPEMLFTADSMIWEVLQACKARCLYHVLFVLLPLYDTWALLSTHPSFALRLVEEHSTEWTQVLEFLGEHDTLKSTFDAALSFAYWVHEQDFHGNADDVESTTA